MFLRPLGANEGKKKKKKKKRRRRIRDEKGDEVGKRPGKESNSPTSWLEQLVKGFIMREAGPRSYVMRVVGSELRVVLASRNLLGSHDTLMMVVGHLVRR